MSTHRNVSPETAEKVEKEVSRIIEEEYDRARNIIEENREKIEVMAKALLEWETLDSDQVDEIMAGKKPSPPEMKSKDDKPTGSSSDDSKDDAPSLDESDLDLAGPQRVKLITIDRLSLCHHLYLALTESEEK